MKRSLTAALILSVLLGTASICLRGLGVTSAPSGVASIRETLAPDFLSVDAPRSGVHAAPSGDDTARMLNDWTFTRLGRFSRGH